MGQRLQFTSPNVALRGDAGLAASTLPSSAHGLSQNNPGAGRAAARGHPPAGERGGCECSRRMREVRVALFRTALCCFGVLGMSYAPAAFAQSAWEFLNLAQAAPAPKRALPIPNKPVSIEEADKAARINNWTVG